MKPLKPVIDGVEKPFMMSSGRSVGVFLRP